MKTVAFICVHNSCRSQMAEGWAKALGQGVLTAYSAGTEAYPAVQPLAVEVMQEVGVDIADQSPKIISAIPKQVDILITMGCNVTCPIFPITIRKTGALRIPLVAKLRTIGGRATRFKSKCAL